MSARNIAVIGTIVGAALISMSPRLRAETAICEWSGSAAVHEAITVLGEPSSLVGGEAQKTATVRHSALRALLVTERCPLSAERVFSEHPEGDRAVDCGFVADTGAIRFWGA